MFLMNKIRKMLNLNYLIVDQIICILKDEVYFHLFLLRYKILIYQQKFNSDFYKMRKFTGLSVEKNIFESNIY